MSDRTYGVVFEASEDSAVEFFSELNAPTFLRLTRLDADELWGVYAEGWPGDREVLEDVAIRASARLGKCLLYRYDDILGHYCVLFENGTKTRSQDVEDCETPRFRGDVFKVFGHGSDLHDTVEKAFRWGDGDWEFETGLHQK